jgi:hypothetical protein
LRTDFRLSSSEPYLSEVSPRTQYRKGHTDCMSRKILGATRLHLNSQRRRFLEPSKLPCNHHKPPRTYHFHFHTWRQYKCNDRGNNFPFDQSKRRTRRGPFISRSDSGNRIRCRSCPRSFDGEFRLATTQKSDDGWVGMRCGGL